MWTTRSFKDYTRDYKLASSELILQQIVRMTEWFFFSDAIRCIKHYSLPRISNAKFPRREITRKCRDRVDTLREIGSPRRAYHASSLAAARHLFFAEYQKQPRHRAADDRRSQSNADRALAIARIHLSLPHSLSPVLLVSLPSSFSLFFPPPPPLARRPSHPFAFLRVVRAYEFDFTRFPSIGERRKLFLEQPISPCPPPNLCLVPRPLFLPCSSYFWLGLFLLRLFRPTP